MNWTGIDVYIFSSLDVVEYIILVVGVSNIMYYQLGV